jgi:hypothetical protein
VHLSDVCYYFPQSGDRYAAERGFERVGKMLLKDPRTDAVAAWYSAEAWHQTRAVGLLLTNRAVQDHVIRLPIGDLQHRRATLSVLNGWLREAVLIIHAGVQPNVRKNVRDVMRLLILTWCVPLPRLSEEGQEEQRKLHRRAHSLF